MGGGGPVAGGGDVREGAALGPGGRDAVPMRRGRSTRLEDEEMETLERSFGVGYVQFVFSFRFFNNFFFRKAYH
jgi:hypothetical protein